MRAVVPTVAVFAPLLLAPAAAEAKDAWDKLESVSGLISGILVAVIGAIATYIYNDRQSKAQARQAEREVAVQQVQTVATLMPSLRSTDPLEKETALLSISELGNPQLAVRLATLYRDEGSVGALTRIAAHSADREAAAAAAESLDEILEALRASVVEVVGSRGPMATGFVVRPDGLTLTTDYSGHNIKSVKVEDG